DFHASVITTILGALEHGSFPLALLVERLRKPRSLDSLSLLEVMFAFQKAQLGNQNMWAPLALGLAGERIQLQNLPLESLPLIPQMIQFELTLSMAEFADGLAGTFEYDTGLFDDSTITRLSRHFNNLLESFADSPCLHVSDG